jgi:sugar O-acyltransferase (sialic acid O-acetyltransferase NeuD family)
MRNIMLIGGGGHCRSVIDVIEQQGIYKIAGIVDVASKIGSEVLGYKVIAKDEELPLLVREYEDFCLTIGHTTNRSLRKELYLILMGLNANLPVIKSPHAYVAKSALIMEGSVIMHHSVINANARLGVCTIANTGCIIEHDVEIGNHCHIGPGSILNGGCKIEEDCFVGSNSVLLPGITMKKNSIIAAGSVIRNYVEENSLYAGNPGKLKKMKTL